MEELNVFNVQIPDGRQIHCISYNKVMSEFLRRDGNRYWTTIDGVRQLYRRIECKMCFEVIEKLKKIMREQEFDFVVYPLKLIITVGLDYETLCNRFENMEPDHKGEWGNKEDMDKEASFVNLVKDRDDDGRFAILWNFSSDDDITIKNTCHESFHVAMSVCQFCNMSLGFKVGEDEHAAYIAGFAGGCAYDFLYSNSTE